MTEIIVPLGKLGKRVVLSKEEVMLLKELSIHRVMRATEVHSFLLHAYNFKRNKNALTNRLTRLVKAKILTRLVERVSYGVTTKRYYYKLGSRGIDVLVRSNLLSPSDGQHLYQYMYSPGFPSEHDNTASKIANRVTVEKFKNILLDFKHCPGTQYERMLSDEQNGEKSNIIADWVFERKNLSIFLEVDTGSQNLNVIQSKLDRYFELAQKQDRQFYIIFSVMDGFANEIYEDRSKRIASIKESISPYWEWPENVSIYVLAASRTPSLIIRLLTYEEPLSIDEKIQTCEFWITQWNTVIPNAITYLDKSEVYHYDFKEQLKLDVFVQDNINKSRIYGIFFAEEGSVAAYQKLRSNYKLKDSRSITDIIVIYANEEQSRSDIYGSMWENVWITDIHTWDEHTAKPKVMKLRSPYRKEYVYFE